MITRNKLMISAGLLIASLLIASGYTTAQTDSTSYVQVDSSLIPLWYKTILQYKLEKAVNDTLRSRLLIYSAVYEKLNKDYIVMNEQKELLLKMVDNKVTIDSMHINLLIEKDNKITKQKFYIRSLAVLSIILGLLAAFK